MKFCDLELERCVIGTMLMDNSIVVNVANYVNADDFSVETNRAIFRAILKLHSEKRAIDIITLNTMKVAMPGYIAELTDIVATGANWDFYAGKLKTLSLVRNFYSILEKHKGMNELNILEGIGDMSRDLLKLADKSGSSAKVKTLRDVMPAVCDRLAYAVEHKGQLFGYDTGWKHINDYIGGLQEGYIIIGARPSVGKTSAGMNLSINLAKNKSKGVIFQLEMSDEAIAFRAISSESGISMSLIKGGFVDNGKPLLRVQEAMETVARLPIAIEDRMNEIHEMEARIRYLVRCEGYKWVMIDHFSLITTKNNRIPRHEQFTEISGIIRNLRKELKIPIVVLFQLRRDAEGKKPSLADLRETGSAEQDADVIIFIHRERQEDLTQTEIETDFIIAKQRDGPCGVAKMTFFPQMVRFSDSKQVKQDE